MDGRPSPSSEIQLVWVDDPHVRAVASGRGQREYIWRQAEVIRSAAPSIWKWTAQGCTCWCAAQTPERQCCCGSTAGRVGLSGRCSDISTAGWRNTLSSFTGINVVQAVHLMRKRIRDTLPLRSTLLTLINFFIFKDTATTERKSF